MATRNWTIDKITNKVAVATVSGLLNEDTSNDLKLPMYPNKTFHVFGTFGVGGNLLVRGRNGGVSPTNLQPLHKLDAPANNLSTVTAETLASIVEDSLFVVANVSAGDGTTSLTVVCMASE